ncbi:MAG: glucose-1-phosphate cytidylyltransferase [Cyanobacteria bacterium]|nr:glucose-1-phosphate cytidylyltransferase [Cyanobacteriota bacterium]
MKVVILAGGLGTRLSEETEVKPKPMVEIGGKPMIWHIMKVYAHFGFNEFVIALGYKGDIIKRFFLDYQQLSGDLTIDLGTGTVKRHKTDCEDWTVHLIDTGIDTATGGRIKRLRPWLRDETFMLTYGDGIANVDPRTVIDLHRLAKALVTVTAVRPPARFGGVVIDGNLVHRFAEKPQIGEGWINGGFMVCDAGLFDYLDGDDTSLESHALERLSVERKLAAYRHDEFWQCMDTLRDVRLLQSLWNSEAPPWRVWG